MQTDPEELYKQRTIQFCPLHADPEQARSAALWLSGIKGVQRAQPLSSHALSVIYDLRQITLCCLERALGELGYHLDNSLLCKLKRALFHYAEETQRENLAITQDCELTRQDVFLNRYQHLAHGCRDPQPEYWREYQ